MGKEWIIEGYVYIYPYLSNGVFLHPKKASARNWREVEKLYLEVAMNREGVDLVKALEKFVGKKVRVSIEPGKRMVVEVVEGDQR